MEEFRKLVKVGDRVNISTPTQREHLVEILASTDLRMWGKLLPSGMVVQWYGRVEAAIDDNGVYHLRGNFFRNFDAVNEVDGVWDAEAQTEDKVVVEEWWCNGHPLTIIEESGTILSILVSPGGADIWQIHEEHGPVRWICKRRNADD